MFVQQNPGLFMTVYHEGNLTKSSPPLLGVKYTIAPCRPGTNYSWEEKKVFVFPPTPRATLASFIASAYFKLGASKAERRTPTRTPKYLRVAVQTFLAPSAQLCTVTLYNVALAVSEPLGMSAEAVCIQGSSGGSLTLLRAAHV